MDSQTDQIGIIDIGSNTIKLLIAERQGTQIRALKTRMEECRISRDMILNPPTLDPTAMIQASEAVLRLVYECQHSGVSRIQIIATSAVRDAVNQSAFCDLVHEKTGKGVEVLSGEEEAREIARGLNCDPALKCLTGFIHFDLGGGSLEFNRIEGSTLLKSVSMPLGAVRLTHHLIKDPKSPLYSDLKSRIEQTISSTLISNGLPSAEDHGKAIVLTGGAATLIRSIHWQREFSRISETPVEIDDHMLDALYQRIAQVDWETRLKIPYLPINRADVFPAALIVLQTLLKTFKCNLFRHSLFSLRHGVAHKHLIVLPEKSQKG